jgi:hypothetical protein
VAPAPLIRSCLPRGPGLRGSTCPKQLNGMPGKKPPGPLAQTVSQESFNVATKGRQAGIARPIHIAFMSRVVRMILGARASEKSREGDDAHCDAGDRRCLSRRP